MGALAAGAAGGGSDEVIPRLESGPLPPLHPTAIMGHYKDRQCQVVGVSGDNGVVDDKGTQVRLASSAAYEPVRANAFLPGSIEVKGQTASSKQVTNVYRFSNGSEIRGGIRSEGSEYKATIVASQAFPRCYLVLLFFEEDFLEGLTDNPYSAIAFQNIGDVHAGVETKVNASFGYIDPSRRALGYLPLLFSRGGEIRTNYTDDFSWFFRRVEMVRHKRLVARYLEKNPRTTSPVRPYLRFPPVFPPGLDRSGIPAQIDVDFTVTSEGNVEEVKLPKTAQADALAAIARALQGWLYLPRLDNGQPVDTALSFEFDFPRPPPPGR